MLPYDPFVANCWRHKRAYRLSSIAWKPFRATTWNNQTPTHKNGCYTALRASSPTARPPPRRNPRCPSRICTSRLKPKPWKLVTCSPKGKHEGQKDRRTLPCKLTAKRGSSGFPKRDSCIELLGWGVVWSGNQEPKGNL